MKNKVKEENMNLSDIKNKIKESKKYLRAENEKNYSMIKKLAQMERIFMSPKVKEDTILKVNKEFDLHIKAKLDEKKNLKEKYLRLLATIENDKLHLKNQNSKLMEYQKIDIIATFLKPLLIFENALKFIKTTKESETWLVGFRMIHQQLIDSIIDFGVTRKIVKIGDNYDHLIHNPIELVETDKPELNDTIAFVSNDAFMHGDKVVMLAAVKINKFDDKKNSDLEPKAKNQKIEDENN